MSKRGAIYVYWGDRIEPELKRSIASIEQLNYAYKAFRLEDYSNLNDKSKMFDLSPYETSLYLDTDTVVLQDLEFGFEMAERHGMAVCLAPFYCASRWGIEDIPEYNTGVIFFKKTAAVKSVFDRWQQIAHHYPNDQAGFAKAIYDLGFNPFVLPMNYNYRYDYHRGLFLCGKIKVWHSREAIPDEVFKEHPVDCFWGLPPFDSLFS